MPRLVVIDDAHSLPSASVRYLNRRLSDDPDSIRLILLTRWDLAISRLVPELLGHLTVLRGDILKLSDDETARLVAEHARTDAEDICQAIAARAEGWCAAVVLAARAGAAAPSRAEFIRRCQEAGPGVADLVAGEVFAALRSRERHLLLCTAAEPVLTAETARHLTRDPSAGDVLATLESTGLLVIRVADSEPDDEDSTRVRFRIHPLLLEVARRRLIAGGVDVQQAHGTVLRAARLDLARGDTADGFRRLVSLGEYDEAAAVLAEHGPRLVGNGNPHVDAFVRQADSVVDAHPETWPAIAWARRLAGDEDGAQHWVDRVLRVATAHPGPSHRSRSRRSVCSRRGAAWGRCGRGRGGRGPSWTRSSHCRCATRSCRCCSWSSGSPRTGSETSTRPSSTSARPSCSAAPNDSSRRPSRRSRTWP